MVLSEICSSFITEQLKVQSDQIIKETGILGKPPKYEESSLFDMIAENKEEDLKKNAQQKKSLWDVIKDHPNIQRYIDILNMLDGN